MTFYIAPFLWYNEINKFECNPDLHPGMKVRGFKMKKVLFAASECVPFIKTGGLADVCGALPKQFDKEEWDVRVVIPNYSCIPENIGISLNMSHIFIWEPVRTCRVNM